MSHIPFSHQEHKLMIDVPDLDLRTRILYAQKSTADLMTLIEGLTLYPGQKETLHRLDVGVRELLTQFRGYGKSTKFEKVAAREMAFLPDTFVMYYSSTEEAAIDHGNAVKDFFERDTIPATGDDNPFKQLLPQRSDKYTWNDQTAILSNGNRISCAGIGTFVLGKKEKATRPTLIIIDDPTDPEQPGTVRKTIKWLKDVITPMGGLRTRILIGGVVYFYDDIIWKLTNDPNSVYNLTYLPAEDKHGKITIPEWWLKRQACCADDLKNCSVLYGDDLVAEHVRMKKLEMEEEWATQFLLIPVDEESSLFPMATLKKCRDEKWTFQNSRDLYESFQITRSGVQPYKTPTVIGCDHGFGMNKKSDWSVFTVITCDPYQPVRILDAYCKQNVLVRDQIDEMRRLNEIYKPVLMYTESNQAQIVFSQELERYSDIPVVAYQTGAEKHRLNVGLPSLKRLFESGKIIAPYGDDKETRDYTDGLFRQLNGLIYQEGEVISVTPHDDYAMSLWLAYTASREFTKYAVVNYGAISI